MNIAIVEDNRQEAELLTTLLKQYQQLHPLELHLAWYPSGESFLAASSEAWHLVFMDIYMEETDGIETAQILFQRNINCLIVFFTTSREDIWRAVSVHNCFDYIEKSRLDYLRIEKILDDSLQKLRFQTRFLEFYSGKQKIRLPLSRLQYLISHDKYTHIVLESGEELCFRTTFSSLLAMLKSEPRFLLCNRGILLNMDFIKKTDREIFVMANEQHFPIRKSNRRDILKTFADYQFQKLEEKGTL